MTTFQGGCLCGAVRFEAAGLPITTNYCHCHSCRRQTGAPVAGFATYACDRFTWLTAEPATYRSSPEVIRRFCGRCGTPLTYEASDRPAEIDIAIGTFDAPDQLPPPSHHGFFGERIAWFDTRDELPRHGGGDDTPCTAQPLPPTGNPT